MREILTKDPKKILKEVGRLIKNRIPVTLLQEGAKPQQVFIRGIDKKKTFTMLVVFKPKKFVAKKNTCVLFYNPENHLMRGFQGAPIKESSNFIGVMFPQDIFQIQRRRFERLETPGQSTVVFAPLNSNRILTCDVEDICKEGACIKGTNEQFESFAQGDTIGPLSFTLCMKNSRLADESMNVIEATIARKIINKKDNIIKLGLHFSQSDTNMETLENYINLRTLEDATA
jgi:hypothetical protein